jgi:alkylhydroperoxidase family enzyme
MTTHEDLEELLGVFALDALDADEAELVSRHLATCPRCRAEVADHREVAGMLGYMGQEAPVGVWDRIAANLGDAPPAVRLDRVPGTGAGAVVPITAARRTRRVRALVAAASAVAAAVIAVLGVQVVRLDNKTSSLSSQMAGPNMAEVQAALRQPGTKQVALRPLSGGKAVVDAVIKPDGSGYIYGSDLPPLASDRTYQLWGVVGDNRISYGVLGNAPGIEPFRVSDGISALAITDEVAGGVVTSSRAPVALGSVSS